MYIRDFKVKNPPDVFHITNIANLRSIARKGLLSTTAMKAVGMNHVNIAYAQIQARRAVSSQMKMLPSGVYGETIPSFENVTDDRSPFLVSIRHAEGNLLVFP